MLPRSCSPLPRLNKTPHITTNTAQSINMTRSHKFNDRVHNGQTDPAGEEPVFLPKYFGKHGFPDTDPNKTKKNGNGRGNWGSLNEEIEDIAGHEFNMAKARRRSNSSTLTSTDFKTKFDINEPEPVFEEELHGPLRDADEETVASSVSDAKSN